MTVPPARNAGFSAASFSSEVSGRGCSSRADVADRHELVVEAAGLDRGRVPALALEREGVLVVARDAEALGDVLAGLAHRLEREHRLEARVREAPAERRVPDRLVAARVRRARPWPMTKGARVIDSTPPATNSSPSPARTRVAGGDDGGEARGAQPVDRDPGHLLRQAGEQRGHAGDVAVVLPGLVGGAEVDVLDLRRGDAGALDRRADDERCEVVGPLLRQARRRSGRRGCARLRE